MELGESAEETGGKREVLEETELELGKLNLVGMNLFDKIEKNQSILNFL